MSEELPGLKHSVSIPPGSTLLNLQRPDRELWQCPECGEFMPGPERSPAAAEAEFRAKVARLLRRIERSETLAVCRECRVLQGVCPLCGGECVVGQDHWIDHRPDCALAQLLKEAEGA